jgi:hypothetical protein
MSVPGKNINTPFLPHHNPPCLPLPLPLTRTKERNPQRPRRNPRIPQLRHQDRPRIPLSLESPYAYPLAVGGDEFGGHLVGYEECAGVCC